jgi:signal transduction histidine kinase
LKYQYKLEGIDADWNPATDQRSASYARLGSGSYRFMVRAINSDGTPGAQAAVLPFLILPPIWQRWWALSLAAGAIGAVAYTVHHHRLRRALELEHVRTRIAADLHDDIGSSLSRIAIQSEVARRHASGVQDVPAQLLSNIADTARSLVDAMSDIVWSIDPKRDDLATVVVRVREFAGEMFDGIRVRWEFSGPSDAKRIAVSPDHRRQLFLILKEAITNIARHSNCATASINLTVDERGLRADIRDDGRGLPAGYAESEDRPGAGYGLRSMRARAASLGGAIDIRSAPGGGTHITLQVPLR